MPPFLTESPSYYNRELLEVQVQYLYDRVAGNEAEPERTEGSYRWSNPYRGSEVPVCECLRYVCILDAGWRRGRVGYRDVV